MKLKVTKHLTYLEARKLYDQQPEFTFAKVVQSLSVKPETKTAYTQYNVEDSKITEGDCRKMPETKYKFPIYIIGEKKKVNRKARKSHKQKSHPTPETRKKRKSDAD